MTSLFSVSTPWRTVQNSSVWITVEWWSCGIFVRLAVFKPWVLSVAKATPGQLDPSATIHIARKSTQLVAIFVCGHILQLFTPTSFFRFCFVTNVTMSSLSLSNHVALSLTTQRKDSDSSRLNHRVAAVLHNTSYDTFVVASGAEVRFYRWWRIFQDSHVHTISTDSHIQN